MNSLVAQLYREYCFFNILIPKKEIECTYIFYNTGKINKRALGILYFIEKYRTGKV